MPPVPPLGSRSRSVTFHASLVPVFWTLKPNCPHCPRLIVAGPDLVNTRSGAPTIPPTVIETLALAVCGGVFHVTTPVPASRSLRSEEHTSELQSHLNLVCRLLLEKKKKSKTARNET